MNCVLTSEQMRDLDRSTIDEFGLSAQILMANAGRAIADYIIQNYNKCRCAVICGSGNNGGDGYACALFLAGAGITADIYETKADGIPETPAFFRDKTLTHCSHTKISQIQTLNDYDVIVDALTGTGFRGKLREDLQNIIEVINSSNAVVVAADLPSGLCGDKVNLPCVHADVTITMGMHKPVTATYPGKHHCGKVIVADIGFPDILLEKIKPSIRLFSVSDIHLYTPVEKSTDTHKYQNGPVLVIAGSAGMEGAALLTCSALIECGCGIAVIITSEDASMSMRGRIPELIVRDVNENTSDDDLESVMNSYIRKGFSTVLAGPGLGRSSFAERCIRVLGRISKVYPLNIILDADALYYLPMIECSFRSLIITPHFGEASILLGISAGEISLDRIGSACSLSKKYNCITHLKGACPVTTDGSVSLLSESNDSRIACAGSGDVLSGIIASIVAKKYCSSQLDSVAFSAELHSTAASCVEGNSLRAGDIISNIRSAWQRIMRQMK